MSEEKISHPTLNFDQKDIGTEMSSIFTLEENFDPQKACEKLVARTKASEKYVGRQKLAQGGMGTIYAVYDRDLKRSVAMKIILPNIMANRQMFLNFIDEARITGQLEHPNIIPVHDLGVAEGNNLYFSMKKIVGEELSSILRRLRDGDPTIEGKYDLFALLSMFRKVCDAVAFAHSKDIIHRDIKPDNIMVADYGEVLLVDWGLARRLGEPDHPVLLDGEQAPGDPLSEAAGDRTPTRFGMIKGTPAFMPPEMAKGAADEIDKRSDIFLLGSTLYTISTLYAPFRGEDVIEIIDNAENCDFEHPQKRAPNRGIPAELSRIILKSMAYSRDDRYQTVNDLIEDIDDLIAGRTASEQRVFKAGEHLMVQNEVGEECYVIVEGRVEVYVAGGTHKVSLVELTAGDCIGEMGIISKAPRSASVQALVDTTVVVITQELIQRSLDKLPPWLGNVVQAIVRRLRIANVNVHPLVNASCAYHVLNQLWMMYLCWGKPLADAESGTRVVLLDYDMAVREIVTNTGLNRDRVLLVLEKLAASGIMAAYDEDRIYIPNIGLLRQFINYIQEQQQNIDAPFAEEPNIALYANVNEFVVSRPLTDGTTEAAELEPVLSYPAEQIMGCETTGEMWVKFDEIINTFQGK